MQSMNKNYWVVKRDGVFSQWYAQFPKGEMLDPWQQWTFLKGILEAGEQEGIYQVREFRAPTRFVASPSLSYIQYLEQVLKEQGELLFFQQINNAFPCPTEEGIDQTPTRLCYYEADGTLTEQEVNNLGELLERLRPDLEWDRYYMTQMTPVDLYGQRAYRFDDGHIWPLDLGISLRTDIWFPKVLGYLEEREYFYAPLQWRDNRELAYCHTPRLNRFLAKAKALTLDLGGEWGLADKEQKEVEYRQYAEMLTDDGIILDI
jgi:hypothetical protein